DFASTAFNTSGEVSGGWYNSAPSNGQGDPDADNRVLFARFSYKQNKNTTGDVCIFTQLAGSGDIIEFLLLPFDCSVPNGDLPSSGGPNPGCDGAAGSCREVNGSAGCDCPECCETVCALDPSCCNDTWSQACVDLACAECDLDACGECADATGSCYEQNPNGTPGCDCQECCNAICCVAPICCSDAKDGWNSLCAGLAIDLDTGCPPPCSSTTYQILHVDGDKPDGGNGETWTTAFNDLQDALDLAGCCDSLVEQVWVAKATNPYLPDRGTGDRNETFRMTSGVQILGGFPPGGGDLVDRLPDTHVTVLSGDLGTPGDNSDNSFHVVTAERTDETGVLDGFTVTAGNSEETNCDPFCPLAGTGGGVVIADSSPTLIDCIITANTASASGGGVRIAGGSPSLTDCDLTGNVAGSIGGGLYLSVGQGSVELNNCTVTSNQATGSGGGLYLAGTSATITGSTISSNSSTGSTARGGGVAVTFGTVKFDGCTISGNDAPAGGGGLYLTGATDVELVGGCVVNDNTAAGSGGGINIANVTSALLDGCSLSGNSTSVSSGGGGAVYAAGSGIRMENCTVLGNSSAGGGGGLYVSSSGTPKVVSCHFEGNSSTDSQTGGGAIYTVGDPLIVNCVFEDNTATFQAGAIFNDRSSNPTIVNSLFFGNTATSHGGAMYNFDSNPTVVNCTFSDNESVLGQAGGIFNDESLGVNLECHNTVLWGNIAGGVMDEAAQITAPVGSFVVTYTTIQGLIPFGPFDDGTNIPDDPTFVDVLNDDYHLLAGSPAIDHGDNTKVPLDVVDIDHDGDTTERTPLDLDPKPRFMNDPASPELGVADPPDYLDIVDMGAYEFFSFTVVCEPCPTDVDNSGNTGPFDLAVLLGNWGPDITDPLVLCLDADGDFRIGPWDLAVLLGNWGPCP
ncbi:MAG: hypothetical protein IIA27_14445, partial [Gemmatimonadetes bacterium]|nr:hypothetical protein [Gemmatimonadota bacterium]